MSGVVLAYILSLVRVSKRNDEEKHDDKEKCDDKEKRGDQEKAK